MDELKSDGTADPRIIGDRLTQVSQELPPHTKLVVVTKYVPASTIRLVYDLGVRDFGESRVQVAQQKRQELADLPDINWHLIGSLQTNKAKSAIATFEWIHSLDRLPLAQELDRLLLSSTMSPQILLQIKPAPDPDKSGWTVEQLYQDLPQLLQCHNLKIVGLMTILPLGLDHAQSLELFSQVADLRQQLQSDLPELKHLSMGMSADYRAAIAAGATMVRIGTRLFS
ncbi:MAG: YggS family pyridoxal phosphate-dependent enzyme [Pseudanabaenaceae cyanobacterium bins.68]|nr:YggS family pyridoxal phosphate-dependent enzyme [Pseudanabaenaceae cyanobacterium bins.68]